MKRYQMVECWEDNRFGESEMEVDMVEREDGPYCLFSEANALIGDLRKRLEEANSQIERLKGRGFDSRYPYSERPYMD